MNTELTRLCEKLGIRITNKYTGEKPPWHEGSQAWAGAGWRCTLRLQGRQLTTSFFQGSALTREPTAADVLYCLCSDTGHTD